MRVDTNRDERTILRDILRAIATNNDIEPCIDMILQSAQSMTGASGGCFLLLDSTNQRVSRGSADKWVINDDLLRQSIQAGVNGLQRNPETLAANQEPFATILGAAVTDGTQQDGVIWFLYDHDYTPTDDETALIGALVDAASIVVAQGRMKRWQKRQKYQLATSVLDGILDPLLVLDEERNLVLMNMAAESVLGAVRAEVIGQPFRSVAKAEPLIQLVYEAKALSEWESEEGVTYSPRMQPLLDTDGNEEGWVLALRDITRFKKLNLNQSEFMRIVSHDLRSPLTSMQGFGSMLESGMVGELNEKQAHFVDKILAGITQITALVDNIQDAGRFDPETGFYEMARAQCDISGVVRQIVDSHLVPAEKQELSITVNIADDVPIINADNNMLERAVTNLIDNAIKYTPNGGKIEVGARSEDKMVVISVKDTGPGISAEQQKHLFKRHVRLARKENVKIKGSGLGLFIVRSVAQRHGGDAWVESAEGNGSTFFLGIPLSGDNLIIPH